MGRAFIKESTITDRGMELLLRHRLHHLDIHNCQALTVRYLNIINILTIEQKIFFVENRLFGGFVEEIFAIVKKNFHNPRSRVFARLTLLEQSAIQVQTEMRYTDMYACADCWAS